MQKTNIYKSKSFFLNLTNVLYINVNIFLYKVLPFSFVKLNPIKYLIWNR